MTDNPYAAPKAAGTPAATEQTIRLYSPTQVACGTLGGPVGLVYFLSANFSAMGNSHLARRTILLGIVFIAALLVILPLLPAKTPSAPFTVAYILVARYVSEKFQMTKQAIADSPRHDFHSNWRVLGLALPCLAGSFLVIAVPLGLLATHGIIHK